MKLDKENTKQILKIVIIAIVVLVALINIASLWNAFKVFLDIISPFIWGIGIAFILNIFMMFYENKVFKNRKKNKKNGNAKRKNKKGLKRGTCIFLSIITIIAVIAIIMVLIIPQLAKAISGVISNIPTYIENLKDFGISITEQVPEINTFIQNININTDELKDGVLNISKQIITVTVNQLSNIFSGIVDFVIAIVFAVYILANKETLKKQVKKVIYAWLDREKANHVVEISRLARDSFKNFLTGQATEAVILGVLCAIGMLILNLPYAGPIGALTGLMAFIPIVGAFIGGLVGAILIATVNPIKAVIFIIFIIVLQQIEGNLIYPHVVGTKVGLPSMWVLVAITIGGSLFGIIGMLIGIPILAVIYAIVMENTNIKLKEKQLEKKFE